MTNLQDSPAVEGGIAVLELSVNGVQVQHRSTTPLATVPGASASHSTSGHDVLLDRAARLQLLAGSAFGVACLLLAYRLQPQDLSPFAAPSGSGAWISVICGIAGMWLVPGLWLSAVLMRTGIGPVALLATRLGTTLVWYGLAGPVIHQSANGAKVTPGGIFGVTAAATAAVCLGVALGLLRRPTDARLRIVVAGVAGGVCAQTAISLSMRVWDYGINYEHIRRLDWLIVMACAFLAAVGMHSRQELLSVRTPRHTRTIVVSLAVIAMTTVALLSAGAAWSPGQRMASAFSLEQVPARAGADVAFALSAIGPEGSLLIDRASFTAADDTGRPLGIHPRVVFGDRPEDRATLVVVLDPGSRSVLCERAVSVAGQGFPVKVTIRDQTSGALVQAVLPDAWCAR